MRHGTGFGATFFYHALGDLKNFIELKMKGGSKYTLVSLGDAEKFDDSNEVKQDFLIFQYSFIIEFRLGLLKILTHGKNLRTMLWTS